jgi:UPF0716 protein FxsA
MAPTRLPAGGVGTVKLVKWLLVGLLALPAFELAGFFLIAALIGWLWAGLLLVASSMLGFRLLRKFGKGDLERIRTAIAYDGLRAIQLQEPSVARIAGALLLAIPGFITDAIGAALFIPALRKHMAAALGASTHKRSVGPQDRTVDLAPSEWREETTQLDDQRSH